MTVRMRPGALLLGVLALAAAPAATAQERVLLRRFADAVAVRQGEAGRERMLYYFSPTADLGQGDEIEQEGGAHSELLMSLGGRVELTGPAHVVLAQLAPEGDLLRFHEITRVAATAGDRNLRLQLPGGYRLVLQNTRVDVQLELGRLRVRNTGGLPVRVIGVSRGRDAAGAADPDAALQLERGEEVRLPNFEGVVEPSLARRLAWIGGPIWHDDGCVIAVDGGQLALRAEGAAGGRAVVAGVRTRVPAGGAFVVESRRGRPDPGRAGGAREDGR